MTITKESFVDLQEKYTKVIKLLEDSKIDPESERFQSKYAARQILFGMESIVKNLTKNQSSDGQDSVKLTAMLAAIYLHLGIVEMDTEETAAGEVHLQKCKETITTFETRPEIILVTLKVYNQFGILWFQKNPEKSKIYLLRAEKFYRKFKSESADPIDISDIFQANLETHNIELALENLEKLHTFTYYYLAQIFGVLKDALKSAVYCHITLQRQLQWELYEPIDWALNSATLSQYFMDNNGFKQARHHLAASSVILEQYEKKLNEVTERNEEHEANLETFNHRSADVARCWAKYGLCVLSKSIERLLTHTDDIDKNSSLETDIAKIPLPADSPISISDLQHLDFNGIDVKAHELQVTDKFVLTLEDAKKVFLNGQRWLLKAQGYYTLDSLASDYIEIVLDQSQLYLKLLFFDDNTENQAKLHKRRVTLLENILDKVNPQYYLQYCQQIWFELARAYSDILDIKAEKLKEIKDRPSPQALSKINTLIEKSIEHFNNYINSFKDKTTNLLPDKLPDEAEKPFLLAYFHIAALSGRYITLDKQKQLQNVEVSIESYKCAADYCDRNPKAKEGFAMEYGICKEMVILLPIKKLTLNSQ